MYDNEKADKATRCLRDDPESIFRETIDRLIKEDGAPWVREHKKQLLADWEATRGLLGLGPGQTPTIDV
jgi:hypothetical protein